MMEMEARAGGNGEHFQFKTLIRLANEIDPTRARFNWLLCEMFHAIVHAELSASK